MRADDGFEVFSFTARFPSSAPGALLLAPLYQPCVTDRVILFFPVLTSKVTITRKNTVQAAYRRKPPRFNRFNLVQR